MTEEQLRNLKVNLDKVKSWVGNDKEKAENILRSIGWEPSSEQVGDGTRSKGQ